MNESAIEAPKLRVLFLAANPDRTRQLRLEEEARDIRDKIRKTRERDLIDFQTRGAVRVDDLLQELNEYRPHIVHFSGHGAGSAGLCLQTDRGRVRRVSNRTLERAFSALKDDIRLVFLNACYSEEQAAAILKSVDSVVAMPGTVPDRAARFFAEAFYLALGFGRSLQSAFDHGLIAISDYDLGSEEEPRLRTKPTVEPANTHYLRGEDAVAVPSATEKQRVVSDSGTLLLLQGEFFENVDHREGAHGIHEFQIPSDSARVDARIRALNTPHRSERVPYAYGHDGGAGSVQTVESNTSDGVRTWTVVLEGTEPELSFFEQMGGVSYGNYSADDIAELRVRRVLLNQALPTADDLLENFVSGNRGLRVTESVIPKVIHELRDKPTSFILRAARLAVIAQLKLSKAIEHVYELSLGPMDNSGLEVKFRGARSQVYANSPPTMITVEGTCPLRLSESNDSRDTSEDLKKMFHANWSWRI